MRVQLRGLHLEVVIQPLSCCKGDSAVQDMLRSWSEPFREAHGHRPDVRWYELSLVESAVGPLWASGNRLFRCPL